MLSVCKNVNKFLIQRRNTDSNLECYSVWNVVVLNTIKQDCVFPIEVPLVNVF